MNHFRNVKVIGDNIKQSVYIARDPAVPRGHRDYVMSRGELQDFAANPLKWLLGTPDVKTKSTDWGSLLDMLALTPERFDKEYIVRPDKYDAKAMECPSCKSLTDSKKCKACGEERVEVSIQKDWNENSTTCSDWTAKQEKAGFAIAKQKDVDGAKIALERLKKDERASDLINCSKRQMMIIGEYVDRATGLAVPVKILLDLVPDKNHPLFRKTLSDFKTAVSAQPHAWDKAVGEHWYDAQGALYTDLYCAAFPNEERIEWRWVISENQPPYVTGRRIMSEAFMEIGRAKYLSALKDYCVCLATGVWPSYDDFGNNGIDGWGFSEPKEYMIGAAFGMGLSLPEKPKSEPPKEDRFDDLV